MLEITPVACTTKPLQLQTFAPCRAQVAFSVIGDCDPSIDEAVKTTDARGQATVKVMAHAPGVVSVVAAGVDANVAAVLSGASTVFFYVERHYADAREDGYYKG